ncbi:hypothetical protein SBRCBS47491_005952 [Sporothrix bragantina]|uniref:Uncharacterized protein n=1 Tax=Sporothrix bragantina TaxID=671064 RepID=A0ABP0C0U0_9PEZI
MGLRDMLKKKDDDDDEPAITISPPQSSQQHRYEEFDEYQQQYQQQFQQSQQPPHQYHQRYQQQQQQQQQRRKTPPPRPPPPAPLETPEFTFIRSDTLSQEVIHPPGGPVRINSDDSANSYLQTGGGGGSSDGGLASPSSPKNHRHSFGMFRKSSSRSARSSRSASVSSSTAEKGDGAVESTARRLSHRLHLSRTPSTSSHVPANLPEIVVPEGEGEGGNKSMHASSLSLSSQGSSASNAGGAAGGSTASSSSKPPPSDPAVESQWEKRATMLAMENERQQQRSGNSSRPGTPEERLGGRAGSRSPGNRSRSNSAVSNNGNNGNTDGTVSSKELDATIQEAIRLHEEGKLEQSTRMFGILADPRGYNNPLSQVLYGLALRHGWGCAPDTETAVKYLSAAASNAAAVEDMALQAGINKGGAAKGELVLAIFELANCFRHGWGLERDPIAAKQYYETAANLGDTDAMNEAAWCYLEGFGCKKDKFTAAKYYRLAEQNGNKTLGNSW